MTRAPPLVTGALLSPLLGSCWALAPTSLEGLAEATVRAQCHFSFSCCLPPERAVFAPSPYRDEGTCVSESLEEGGGAFSLTNRAREVIAAGKGEYDGARAEACWKPWLDALQACDAETVLSGGLDPLCAAESARMFVQGRVAPGEPCTDDMECADFGFCQRNNDPRTLSVAGTCIAMPTLGEPCEFGCAPGLVCEFTEQGATCVEETRPVDGRCFSDSDCSSGRCAGSGFCNNTGAPCSGSTACGPQDVCILQDGTCTTLDDVVFDVCNGR